VLVLHFSNYVRKYHKILSANPLRIEPTSTSTEGLNAECFIQGLRKIIYNSATIYFSRDMALLTAVQPHKKQLFQVLFCQRFVSSTKGRLWNWRNKMPQKSARPPVKKRILMPKPIHRNKRSVPEQRYSCL
jgi:hypothetical protein